MTILKTKLTFARLVDSIKAVDTQRAQQASQAVNISLTLRNWLIGMYVEEYERQGVDRANYGDKLMDKLSESLTQPDVSRCDRREIYRYRQFYLAYPQIVEAVTPQLEFNHEHIGQLNTYVSWFKENMMAKGDNPPVGILLCTAKDHTFVEYALAGMTNKLFVSKYQLELPKKEEMERFIAEQMKEVQG